MTELDKLKQTISEDEALDILDPKLNHEILQLIDGKHPNPGIFVAHPSRDSWMPCLEHLEYGVVSFNDISHCQAKGHPLPKEVKNCTIVDCHLCEKAKKIMEEDEPNYKKK